MIGRVANEQLHFGPQHHLPMLQRFTGIREPHPNPRGVTFIVELDAAVARKIEDPAPRVIELMQTQQKGVFLPEGVLARVRGKPISNDRLTSTLAVR